MKTLLRYGIAALVLVAFAAAMASAAMDDSGGGLGSTSNQYTGRGYWAPMGSANSPRGGQPNAMTEPTAPWMGEPSIPQRWRAWETPAPSPEPSRQTESRPPVPGGSVEMSGASPSTSRGMTTR